MIGWGEAVVLPNLHKEQQYYRADKPHAGGTSTVDLTNPLYIVFLFCVKAL